MASFGAKYPYFNPVAEEPEGKLPVYKDQDPVRIGRLVKADLTVNLASGKLFADDGLAESVEEFSSGSIAMETDDMEDDVASVVYGAETKDGEVHYTTLDAPPAGGLAYFKKLMRRKKVIYKGYFYPLVMASLGNDTAQTKGDSITFGTNNTTFTVFACEDASWRHTKEFPTEAAALAWIKEKLKGKKYECWNDGRDLQICRSSGGGFGILGRRYRPRDRPHGKCGDQGKSSRNGPPGYADEPRKTERDRGGVHGGARRFAD